MPAKVQRARSERKLPDSKMSTVSDSQPEQQTAGDTSQTTEDHIQVPQ